MLPDPTIAILSEKSGIDFQNYAMSSFERRIESIVQMQFKGDVDAFRKYVNSAVAKEVVGLVNYITVNTTEYYRDWEVWKVIINDIFPRLKTYNTIRIWHAGCSTGEEVYSLAILLAENELKNKVKIVATDISEKALQQAIKGEYREKMIDQNAENIEAITGMDVFKKYFTINAGIWKVRTDLLPEISFRKKDLSTMEPFSKFDVILCRNVMIYFNLELQNRILGLFARSLFKNGCLVTGKKESAKLVCDVKGFSSLNAEERIFCWSDGK